MNKEFRRCECSDPNCPVSHETSQCCGKRVDTILYRTDMEDRTGVAFCKACADDAFESGLFTDSLEDDEEEEATTFVCVYCGRTLPVEDVCCGDGPDDNGVISDASCVDCDGPIHQGSHARLDVGYWERMDCDH